MPESGQGENTSMAELDRHADDVTDQNRILRPVPGFGYPEEEVEEGMRRRDQGLAGRVEELQY